jgi:transcriptional regulator with XRE-family HTH domain
MPCSRFGVRLKAARDEKRWTQAEAAKRAGLQPAAWSHFETGELTPHIRNLRAICKALHVSADYLLDL